MRKPDNGTPFVPDAIYKIGSYVQNADESYWQAPLWRVTVRIRRSFRASDKGHLYWCVCHGYTEADTKQVLGGNLWLDWVSARPYDSSELDGMVPVTGLFLKESE